MDVVDNRTLMYAKQVNLSNLLTRTHLQCQSQSKNIESRLEVIQGQTFWDNWKAAEGLRITV